MRTGIMADWRCSLPVQSPAPAVPSSRTQHHCHNSTAPGKLRESFFESAKVSFLRSVPDEVGPPRKIRGNLIEIEEEVAPEASVSSCKLRFSLLMENLYEIEDLLVDSSALTLQREILLQVERLGAMQLFDNRLLQTTSYLIDNSANSEANALVDHPIVRSGRKKERNLRRSKCSIKTTELPLSAPPESKSGDKKRLLLAKNESRMSAGVKDVATLEKIRDELDERTGMASSFSRWAEAAGTDEKTLQRRLLFGWQCKDNLLRSTRSLVVYLARSYRGMGIAFEDLIQAGNVGVLRGAERFDPSRGYRFSTYVQYWIRKSMLAVVGRYSRGVHIPATMEKAIKEVQKARRTLASRERRRPLDTDVAEITGLSLAKVRLAGRCGRVVGSINQKKGDSFNIKAAETMADASVMTPEEAVMREHMKNDIEKLLESLHPRERLVLLHRYGMMDGRRRSLEEIGQLLRVSKEWIRKLEISGLAKVRKETIRSDLEFYAHPRSG